MPDQTGVAGVAARRESQGFGQCALFGIKPAERRAHGRIVQANRGEEAAVRQADHVRTADPHVEFLPAPLGVWRP